MKALVEYLGIMAVIVGLTLVIPRILERPSEEDPPITMVTAHRDSQQPVWAFRGGELRVLFPLPGEDPEGESWLVHEPPSFLLVGIKRFSLVRATPPARVVVTQEFRFRTPRPGAETLVFRRARPQDDQVLETWRLVVLVRDSP